MIYRLILAIRNARYKGGRHSVKAGVPTVCVGNITVGGTGKTPHAEMILEMLLGSERWGSANLALLSRGYKRRSKGFQQVPYNGTAELYGDEPLQIKRKFPQVTVAVDKNRVEACDILTHPEKAGSLKKCAFPSFPPAELILLDDAYQYRKLQADLNIVLVDFNRPVTEDQLLPGGRLRDLKSRLYDADIVIVTKCPYALEPQEKMEMAQVLGFDSYDPGSCIAVRRSRSLPLLFTGVEYGRPLPVFETEADSRYIYSHKIALFTGIADDTPLRNYLSDKYKIVEHLHFPDHHAYTASDAATLKAALKHNPTAAFVTTEKDAQRLRDFSRILQALRARTFYFPISAVFHSENERRILIEKLTAL